MIHTSHVGVLVYTIERNKFSIELTVTYSYY